MFFLRFKGFCLNICLNISGRSGRKKSEKIKIKSVPTLVLEGMPLYAVEEVQLQRAIDILREQN